jgi:HSP90 family molecular chaperone
MGWSANMQRLMKSQPMGDTKALEYMKGEKILEINPENAVCSQTLIPHRSTAVLSPTEPPRLGMCIGIKNEVGAE